MRSLLQLTVALATTASVVNAQSCTTSDGTLCGIVCVGLNDVGGVSTLNPECHSQFLADPRSRVVQASTAARVYVYLTPTLAEDIDLRLTASQVITCCCNNGYTSGCNNVCIYPNGNPLTNCP